ncbi:MAG TPA: hypothetical protein VJM08_05795, partial [Anaerolineales bacterium]|nr:hypothetical protein [Anaerolineales bacterium]
VLDAVRQVTRSLKDIAFRRRRFWRRKQAQVAEEVVAEKLEQESANVRGTLGKLISNIQDYLEVLMEEHQDHFERLQERLRVAHQPSQGEGNPPTVSNA